MTSFVHIAHPLQHPGVVRFERAFELLRHTPALVTRVLAAIGAPVLSRTQAVLAARRRARDDVRFWNAAQHDARLMADIQRAISSDALNASK